MRNAIAHFMYKNKKKKRNEPKMNGKRENIINIHT